MSSRSALDSLLSALKEGWPFDLMASESIKFLPRVHDRGFFQIGNGTTDMDVKIFLGNTSAYVLFDVGNQALTLTGVTFSHTGDMNVTGALSATTLKVNTTSNTVGAALFGNTIDVTLGATVNSLKVNTTSNTVGAAIFGNTIDATLGVTCNTLKVNTTSNTVGAVICGNTLDVTLGTTCNTLKVNTTSNTVGAALFGNTIDVTLEATVNTLKVNTTSNTVGAAVFGNTTNTTGLATFQNGISVTGLTALNGNTYLSNAGFLLNGFSVLSNRYELKWIAGAHGKIGIAADATDNTTATFAITDPMFEVTGTNCVSACVTHATTGGLTFTTTGASGDQVILEPHSTADISGWKSTTWLSNTSIEWETTLVTDASIANCVIWAGLKLTNTNVVATDDDQAFFRYEAGVANGAIQFISSIDGVDTTTNTNTTVGVSTSYHLKICITGDRICKAYINGTLVDTTAALATNKSLKPYIGVETAAAAAKAFTLRGAAISKAL